MTTRNELIEAGVVRLSEWYGDEVSEIDIVALLDLWEPMIRADEAEGAWRDGYKAAENDLRAKVEALRAPIIDDYSGGWDAACIDVLALFDGSSE